MYAFAQGAWAQANWEAVYAMTNTTSANWTPINEGALHGYTLGSTDSTTYYYANSNLNFYSIDAGVSGLTILGTVYIYIPSGKSLACFGGHASGTIGAGAGIELTSGNTLYLIGDGVVHSTGGNAANGSNGSNGTDAAFEYDEWVRVGGGGNGGGGGGFGGAASSIGTGGPGGGGGGGGSNGSQDKANDGYDRVGCSGGSGGQNGDGSWAGESVSYILTGTQCFYQPHASETVCFSENSSNDTYPGSGGDGGAKGGNTVAGTVNYILATDGSGNYPIYNANDWDVFATQVSNGTTFQGKTVKLMADISVSTMVGTSDNNSFRGSFDGQGHTLTFTKGTASVPFNEEYCAPFRYVKAATIKNLKADGNIYTSQKFAAGLVARNGVELDATYITNCHVSTVIYSSVNGDYLIGSTNDWVIFCEMMNQGINNFSGKTVKLTADINVSTIAGPTATKSFQGTFLGGGHTITATITDTINQGTALFRYINGATIQDLKVAGTITAKQLYAATLVGFSNGTGNSIKNCLVTANVNSTVFVGGIVGNVNEGSLSLSGCVFSGLITNVLFQGAFIGLSNSGTRTITDCLYIMPDGQNTAYLHLVLGGSGALTISRCYKTADVGSQGIKARSITGVAGVTVSDISPVGDSIATYNVSGITAYAKGITCGETFYYGNGDEVNLNLNCISTLPVEYYPSAGTLDGNDNPYTLTMPDADVVINVKSLFAADAGKWYVISTPIHDQGETFESVSQVENLTGDSYDLFRYNETTAKWENQKAGDGATGFDNLAIGCGYIYRCSDDRTLKFKGEPNFADTYSVILTATDSVGELKGYNIVGNPYPFRVHLARDYYSLNPDGTCSEHYYPHNDSLEVGQGALVYTANGETLTFYASTRSTNVGTKGLPPLPKGFLLNDGSTGSPQNNDNGVAQGSNRPFAHISGDQLIVEGTGTLQVFDVIGRLIFRENVSTYQPINVSTFPQAGVYILRLNGQSQKIIIR